MRLTGKVIALTGAAGSLGATLVENFLRGGCEALVLADLAGEGLERIAGTVRSHDVVMPTDVTREEEMVRMVNEAVSRFGRLDVMVNNAGVLAPNARLHNLDLQQWQSVIDVNLLGVVNGTKAALEPMRRQRQGSIINTASVSGMTAWTHSGPYCVTKAAVIHLTKVTAVEYAAEGVRANCVCPGSFRSQMFSGVPDAAVQAISARHPLGLGSPEDLAGTYVFLASEESRWMTGSALVVDGGYSAP